MYCHHFHCRTMSPRALVLALLTICFLEHSNAFPLMGLFVDHAKEAGVDLSGYMALLQSNKSNFLTNILHFLFGNKIERRFRKIIERDVQLMPERVDIDEVKADNKEKMTFKNGIMEGLRSMEITPKTGVEVIWSWSWTGPTAIVSVHFKSLVIKGNLRGKFDVNVAEYLVDGPVEMEVLENNFVLTFKLHPGLIERCYLKLTNVICTDMEHLKWNVKNRKGKNDDSGKVLLQEYFLLHEGMVEDHIKTSVTNMIYHEVPKASPAICDNHNKFLRLSKYQTYHKSKAPTVLIDGEPAQNP